MHIIKRNILIVKDIVLSTHEPPSQIILNISRIRLYKELN